MENLGSLQQAMLPQKTEQALPYPIYHLKGIQCKLRSTAFSTLGLIDALCQAHVKNTQGPIYMIHNF